MFIMMKENIHWTIAHFSIEIVESWKWRSKTVLIVERGWNLNCSWVYFLIKKNLTHRLLDLWFPNTYYLCNLGIPELIQTLSYPIHFSNFNQTFISQFWLNLKPTLCFYQYSCFIASNFQWKPHFNESNHLKFTYFIKISVFSYLLHF